MYDVIIIGGGVIGCAAARELSRYNLNILVLERSNDVANGTSKANSGIVHAGFDAAPGSVKAAMNVLGNAMFDALSRDLGFHFKRNGAFVLCFSRRETDRLEALQEKGRQNGVATEIWEGARIRDKEPHVSNEVVAGLYAPSSGIVCPYGMTVALGESAAMNGVSFLFRREVSGINKSADGFEILTAGGEVYRARTVLNAAGLHSGRINNMVAGQRYDIVARRGEYCLLDRTSGGLTGTTLFQLPSKMGKGVLVSPTVDGNIIIGPTAEDIADGDDTDTTAARLEEALTKAALSVTGINRREIITQFAGNRAHLKSDDFVVGESDVAGFFNAVGIESPGLTAAPAIGRKLSEDIARRLSAEKKAAFIETRPRAVRFSEATESERRELIARDPKYGNIVCRCETVTEAEILAALRSPLPARDLDGIKKRTRAQMGRCQSGFCAPHLVEIIAREQGVPLSAVTKKGGETNILLLKNKEPS